MGGAQADDLHAPASRLTALCPRTRPSSGEGLPGRTAKSFIKLLAPRDGNLYRAREGDGVAHTGKAGDVGEGAPTKAGGAAEAGVRHGAGPASCRPATAVSRLSVR